MKQKKKPRGGRRNIQITIYPKTVRGGGKATFRKKRTSRRQTGGSLNRYDFAYAGRDVINQAGKVAPKIISQAIGEINKIAQQRIDQIIRSGGVEIKHVAPKIFEVQLRRYTKHRSECSETQERNNSRK